MRRERSCDRRHTLCHPTDEEITRRLVRRNDVTDLAAQRFIEAVPFEQSLWMYTDLVIDDELQPRQPDPALGSRENAKA